MSQIEINSSEKKSIDEILHLVRAEFQRYSPEGKSVFLFEFLRIFKVEITSILKKLKNV